MLQGQLRLARLQHSGCHFDRLNISQPPIFITMCRLFAYISVKPILLDDVLRRPKNAITQQILAYWDGPFLSADGFGITWHTDARSHFNPFQDEARIYDGPFIPFVRGPHPAIYKTTIAKPLNDPVFLSLCANVESKTIFAHIRAAYSPPIATTNNHPFVFGRHCFMHNGGVAGFDEIRKDMLGETSEGFAAMIAGGTDTEHVAALYLSYLCDPKDYRGADKHYKASSMWRALQSAIDTIEKLQKARKIDVDNFMNICATDGESLLGLCYRSKIGPHTPPFTLWVSANVADTLDRKPYASKHKHIFEDTRSMEQIDEAVRVLVREAKPAIQRGPNETVDINPDLLSSIWDEEEPHLGRHGPHIVVASEPTTTNPDQWFLLNNRDVVLVDTVMKKHGALGDVQSIEVTPAMLKPSQPELSL